MASGEWSDFLVCPDCGNAHTDHSDIENAEVAPQETYCDACGATFSYVSETTRRYKVTLPTVAEVLARIERPEERRSKTTFEGCVYYACNDPEELCLESPEEAIVERADWILHDTKCPLARESIPEMTVKGYVRDEIDIESESESCAETAVERFDEYLSDEYGDPNGDHKAISKESREVLVSELTAAFAKALKSAVVWRCSIAASRTYSPTEVEAILRAEMPEWFEVSE